MNIDAIESFERNKIIVNDLIDVHEGDTTLVVTDIVMQMSLLLNTMNNKDAARLLASYAIEGIEAIADDL